jgi:hypothetical protein
LVSPVDETLRRSAPSPAIDRDAVGSATVVSFGNQRAQGASMGAAIDAPSKASDDASADEAWARIDLLLNQMRQLTLGGADHAATASATTTTQAIAAYSAHFDGEKGAR